MSPNLGADHEERRIYNHDLGTLLWLYPACIIGLDTIGKADEIWEPTTQSTAPLLLSVYRQPRGKSQKTLTTIKITD